MPDSGTPVLLANDDRLLGKLLARLLGDHGYDVIVAPNGDSAFETLRTSDRPLVVVLNMRTPPLTSIGMLRSLAAVTGPIPSHAHILLTANPESTIASLTPLASQLSVSVVAKPFAIQALLDAVATAAVSIPCVRG